LCSTFYPDADADTYGTTDSSLAIQRCGPAPPSGYVATTGDCCDSDKYTHPGQSKFFTEKNKCGRYDYNCDGADELQFTCVSNSGCDASSKQCWFDTGGALPSCGQGYDFCDSNGAPTFINQACR
jgi:hypothetical protein